MKTIQINTLTLENFKCHSHLRLEPMGKSFAICGDNATGKTSVYDAFVWLLFGKDSLGTAEKSFDVKPLDEWGLVRDRNAITAVEAELLVDGEPLTLRRTFRENWTKRRGSREAVFEGNVSDYFVDGLPLRKSAYDAAVRKLIPEELFRMLTSVTHFAAAMKWQDRRSILFDLAGALSDREILEKSSDFAGLAKEMGKKTLSEYRDKLQKKKKELAGKRQDIPARLSECHRLAQVLEEEILPEAEEETDPLRRLEAQLMVLGEEKLRQTLREKLERRTGTLEAEAAAAEEAIEKIEKSLLTIEEFTRFKAKFLEESVNSHFRLTTFRLFREQNNGGLEDRCDACFGGVPYPGLNNAMRVNVGIDIINTLSRHYGIRLPLFIDNAEAVTSLEDSDTQVIRLVVSAADPVLRTR